MKHHGRSRSASHLGETLRSRLFCRHSDPHALAIGLHSVESCRERLRGVLRLLGEAMDASRGLGDHRVHVGGHASVEQAVTSVRDAVDELAECAQAIETAMTEHLSVGVGEDARWSTGSEQHHPELLEVEVPAPGGGLPIAVEDELDRMLIRCRLQVTAVKDRYSVVLAGLPWVGPDRDHFAGTRLTAVRAHLEAAAGALENAPSRGPCVDLTDAPESMLTV